MKKILTLLVVVLIAVILFAIFQPKNTPTPIVDLEAPVRELPLCMVGEIIYDETGTQTCVCGGIETVVGETAICKDPK